MILKVERFLVWIISKKGGKHDSRHYERQAYTNRLFVVFFYNKHYIFRNCMKLYISSGIGQDWAVCIERKRAADNALFDKFSLKCQKSPQTVWKCQLFSPWFKCGSNNGKLIAKKLFFSSLNWKIEYIVCVCSCNFNAFSCTFSVCCNWKCVKQTMNFL